MAADCQHLPPPPLSDLLWILPHDRRFRALLLAKIHTCAKAFLLRVKLRVRRKLNSRTWMRVGAIRHRRAPAGVVGGVGRGGAKIGGAGQRQVERRRQRRLEGCKWRGARPRRKTSLGQRRGDRCAGEFDACRRTLCGLVRFTEAILDTTTTEWVLRLNPRYADYFSSVRAPLVVDGRGVLCRSQCWTA